MKVRRGILGRVAKQSDSSGLFDGPGEMRRRCRDFDWGATPLGPVSTWSQSLRTTAAIMLASRHPMFLWWGRDLIQIFNDGYLPSFGASGRDVAALGARGREHWSEIWHIIGPEVEAIMEGGESTWHQDHLVPITRNGQLEDVYWTYGYSPVRDDDGRIGGVLVVVQETTERVQTLAERELLLATTQAARDEANAAREQLALLFSEAPVAIAVLTGRDFQHTYANPKYRKMIGDRDPVGKRLTEMFPELAGSEIEGLLERVRDSLQPVAATDFCVRFDSRGEGIVENYYDLVYHPLSPTRTSPRGILVVAVDVTERHDALAERERLLALAEAAREEAERAYRAKSDFLAMMSHELRTPLSAIGGHADLLEMGVYGPLLPDQVKALARIQLGQQHLLSVINGILTFARVEAGAMEFDIEDVVVADVLASAEALLFPRIMEKKLQFSCRSEEFPVRVRADREKVHQIVLNLLSNAVKFTKPSDSITVDCEARADGMIEVSVTDTGPGIPEDQLERVFEPFVQLESGHTREHEGTGLGLAICKELARGMGGDVVCVSTVGVGSRFAVILPGIESS